MRAHPDSPLFAESPFIADVHVAAKLGSPLAFMRLLWALDHALQRRSKWMKSHVGITGPQRLALRVLALSPGLSAGRLAATLKIHPSTLTGILRRLEARGLIRRRTIEQDRRSIRLELTRTGRRLARPTQRSIEHAVSIVIRRAPASRLRATERLLRSLVEALESDPVRSTARSRH